MDQATFGPNLNHSCFPINGWLVKTRKGTIMQSKCTCRIPKQHKTDRHPEYEEEMYAEPCELCRCYSYLPNLYSMPDMLFNNNFFRLEHLIGVGIEFNPLDALQLVQETNDPLKVAVADGWQSARADCSFAKKISRPFDWTFTTNYQGTLIKVLTKLKNPIVRREPKKCGTPPKTDNPTMTVSNETNHFPSSSEGILSTSSKLPNQESESADSTPLEAYSFLVEETDERIDINKLKVKEDILFYDDVTLYEDELADHGTSKFSVKVRVMPSCIYILARFYLRIDGVLARINDTRLYHEFEKDYILREYTNKESKLSELNLPISTIVNPNELTNHLPLIERRCEKLRLPGK